MMLLVSIEPDAIYGFGDDACSTTTIRKTWFPLSRAVVPVPVTLSLPSRAQLHISRMRSSALNFRKTAP